MSYKIWVIKFLCTFSVFVLAIGGFNYWIDPMWTFGRNHEWNDVQDVFNERHQKTNRIRFQPFDVDTLLIGSSRSTYINEHEFTGMKVYNYSVALMSVQEYDSFIQHAKENNSHDISTIIVGLDFFMSDYYQSTDNVSINTYADSIEKPFYRWTNLLSYDITKYSYRNLKASLKDKPIFVRSYDRDNVATTFRLPKREADAELRKKVIKFKETFYGNYKYNPGYKDILLNVKKNNPNSNFIAFTTPISEPLFKALVEEDCLRYYELWLRELIAVYDGVYNFMDINTITKDTSNFFDGHHFYPEVGTLIAHRISKADDPQVPADFGKYITEENIEEYLASLRAQVKQWQN
jgi:hypothetical protein